MANGRYRAWAGIAIEESKRPLWVSKAAIGREWRIRQVSPLRRPNLDSYKGVGTDTGAISELPVPSWTEPRFGIASAFAHGDE